MTQLRFYSLGLLNRFRLYCLKLQFGISLNFMDSDYRLYSDSKVWKSGLHSTLQFWILGPKCTLWSENLETVLQHLAQILDMDSVTPFST